MAADLALVEELAASTHLAVLATTRPDGSVHASLVSAGLLDDPVDGATSVAVVVGGHTRKLAHLRRSGRATAVLTSGFRWVSVEGTVRIIGPDDPADGAGAADVGSLLRRVFVAAGGTHEDWDEFDRVMAAEGRTAVFVHAERVTTNG